MRLFACLKVKSVIPLCIFHLQLVDESVGEIFLGPAVRTVSLSRENMQPFLDLLLKSWHRLPLWPFLSVYVCVMSDSRALVSPARKEKNLIIQILHNSYH